MIMIMWIRCSNLRDNEKPIGPRSRSKLRASKFELAMPNSTFLLAMI